MLKTVKILGNFDSEISDVHKEVSENAKTRTTGSVVHKQMYVRGATVCYFLFQHKHKTNKT